jgi:hypothetical protein
MTTADAAAVGKDGWRDTNDEPPAVVLGGRLVVRHATARGGRGVGRFVSRRALRRVSSAITFAGRGCGACRAVTSVRCRCMSAPLSSLYEPHEVPSPALAGEDSAPGSHGSQCPVTCSRCRAALCERGLEPHSLARSDARYARLDSNQRPLPSQSSALPLSYERMKEPPAGVEPAPRPYDGRVLPVDTTEARVETVAIELRSRETHERSGTRSRTSISTFRAWRPPGWTIPECMCFTNLVVYATRLPFGPGSIARPTWRGFGARRSRVVRKRAS